LETVKEKHLAWVLKQSNKSGKGFPKKVEYIGPNWEPVEMASVFHKEILVEKWLSEIKKTPHPII